MTTFDVHQHLWPEQFIAALQARRTRPLLRGRELETREGHFAVDLTKHDLGVRLGALDADGIDAAVASLQPSLGFDELQGDERTALEQVWIEGMRELMADAGGRLLAFSPSGVQEGFAGVSLGASEFMDLDRVARVLDAATAAGTVVFVHPDAGPPASADRPDWWEWIVGYPARMQEAYLAWLGSGRDRWPTLRVLFTMLGGGGPFQLERLARRGVDVRSALDQNTFLEVSSHGRRAIELCIETFGVAQLAYGSDMPIVDSRPTLDAVRGFGDAVMHVLQSETPARLLT